MNEGKIMVYGSGPKITSPPLTAEVIAKMTGRITGFYWVKDQGDWAVAEWILADVSAMTDTYIGYWRFPGSEEDWSDDNFEEIDERRLVYQ